MVPRDPVSPSPGFNQAIASGVRPDDCFVTHDMQGSSGLGGPDLCLARRADSAIADPAVLAEPANETVAHSLREVSSMHNLD